MSNSRTPSRGGGTTRDPGAVGGRQASTAASLPEHDDEGDTLFVPEHPEEEAGAEDPGLDQSAVTVDSERAKQASTSAITQMPDVLKTATFWTIKNPQMLSPADMVTHHNLALIAAETRENNRLLRNILLASGSAAVKSSSSSRTSITERDTSRKPSQQAHKQEVKQFALEQKVFLQKIVARYVQDGGSLRVSKAAQSFDTDLATFEAMVERILHVEGDEQTATAIDLGCDDAEVGRFKQASENRAFTTEDFAIIFIDMCKLYKSQLPGSKKDGKKRQVQEEEEEEEEEDNAAEGSSRPNKRRKRSSARSARARLVSAEPVMVDDNAGGDEDDE